MVRWLVLIIALATAAGACTLFDEDPPDDSCVSDNDCFRAQGEICNQQTKQCQLRPMDAGIDTP
jgi:hypothetical protein